MSVNVVPCMLWYKILLFYSRVKRFRSISYWYSLCHLSCNYQLIQIRSLPHVLHIGNSLSLHHHTCNRILQNLSCILKTIGYGWTEQPGDSKEKQDEAKKLLNSGALRKYRNTYFSNTSKLGETLMEIMKEEVSEFCKIDVKQNWAFQAHQQVWFLPICIVYAYI